MRRARKLRWLAVAAVLAVAAGFALHRAFRPTPMERTEIFRGVYLTVEELPRSAHGSGRVMIVEVHWDAPGVRLAGRPYSFSHDPADPAAPHYRLEYADRGLARHGAAVLMNTTRYEPHEFWRSLPGMPVRSHESLVVDGKVSHVHAHSYLLYWDAAGEARLLTRKPPDAESLDEALLGTGMQGISVSEGRPRHQAFGDRHLLDSRTFIGVDPQRRILWMLAFERASGYLMAERAVEEGVVFGGMLDSGDGTQLLVGRQALGVRAHTGIRHWRPLGAYLMVFADPL